MTLYNNTPMEAAYGISYGNTYDCGTIPSQQTISNTGWDNQKGVTVVFSSMEGNPLTSGNPFWITIPQTGTGSAVTVGIYQE
jgi:hypothetical protein